MTLILFIIYTTGETGRWIQPPYGGQYYVFLGSEKEPQINVQIWENIIRPGLYSVPRATDVVTLISLAGGPKEGADLSRVKIIRNNPHHEMITVNLSDYIKGKNQSVPILQPDDIVIIPQSKFFTIRRWILSFPWGPILQALQTYIIIRNIIEKE